MLLLSAAIPWAFPCDAIAAAASEYEIKAAFIYNFSIYMNWPEPNIDKPFVIGVIGKDPFGELLDDAMRGKRVDRRKVVVRRFSRLEEIVDSDVLFVASSEAPSLERILKILDGVPVLTIAEMDQFAERGGMINLTTDGNRVRFEVNLEAINRAGLKASSQMLRLAKLIPESSRTK